MKPLLAATRDYYSACLLRLEETRGHILNEQEYTDLRRETLNELTTPPKRKATPGHIVTGVAALLCAVGTLALLSTDGFALPLLGCSIGTLLFGMATLFQFSRNQKVSRPRAGKFEMLESLREFRLVSDQEFSDLREKMKKAA